MATFNLKQLYAASFGSYVSAPIEGLSEVVKIAVAKEFGEFSTDITVKGKSLDAKLVAMADKPGLRTSILGTPIYMPVKINDIWLPNEPMISIEGSMEVVEEPKASGKGTFKEIMGINDYEITIYGIAINEDQIDEYPEQQVSELRSAFEGQLLNGPCAIQSPLMRLFGIDHIVIRKFRVAPGYGEFSYQPYELQCVSDEPVEYELLNNPQ